MLVFPSRKDGTLRCAESCTTTAIHTIPQRRQLQSTSTPLKTRLFPHLWTHCSLPFPLFCLQTHMIQRALYSTTTAIAKTIARALCITSGFLPLGKVTGLSWRSSSLTKSGSAAWGVASSCQTAIPWILPKLTVWNGSFTAITKRAAPFVLTETWKHSWPFPFAAARWWLFSLQRQTSFSSGDRSASKEKLSSSARRSRVCSDDA